MESITFAPGRPAGARLPVVYTITSPDGRARPTLPTSAPERNGSGADGAQDHAGGQRLRYRPLQVPAVASACQCAVPREREAQRAYIMENSRHVFAGQVLSVRKRPPADSRSDLIIEARVRVLKQIKGTLPKEITVISFGGDRAGNCGFGSALAAAWASGSAKTFALNEPRTKNGKTTYFAWSCTPGKFYIDPSA